MVLTISFFYHVAQTSYGQIQEKNFTAPKFGLSMNYPSNWEFVPPSAEEPTSDEPVSYAFCPSTYFEKIANVISCSSDSAVGMVINVYKLENGTTLKEFYDKQLFVMEGAKDLIGSPKYINTSNINISGLGAIRTIDTCCSGGKATDLVESFGHEVPTSEHVSIYIVNDGMGYMIRGNTHDERDFDTYYPTLQKIMDSFQVGARQ